MKCFRMPTGVGSGENAGSPDDSLEDYALKGTRKMGLDLESYMGHQGRDF